MRESTYACDNPPIIGVHRGVVPAEVARTLWAACLAREDTYYFNENDCDSIESRRFESLLTSVSCPRSDEGLDFH